MSSIVSAIVPLLLLIAFGFLLGRGQFLSQYQFEGLSKLTFVAFIPALLFLSIYQSEQLNDVSFSLLAAFYLPLITLFGLSFILFKCFFNHTFPKTELLCLASTFSNNVLIGVPILLTLKGERVLLPAFSIIAFHSLLLFSLTSFTAGFTQSQRVVWYRQIASSIWLTTRSPIVLSLLIGIGFRLLEWELPDLTVKALNYLKQAALPCALILLGATLGQYKVKGSFLLTAIVSTNKLVILPLLVWFSSTAIFQLPDALTLIAVTLSASPVGINVFMFAAQDTESSPYLASSILISTVLSMVSIPIWLISLGLA
jgi:hypothetical protein